MQGIFRFFADFLFIPACVKYNFNRLEDGVLGFLSLL